VELPQLLAGVAPAAAREAVAAAKLQTTEAFRLAAETLAVV
jgi:hypothetical protein